MLPDVSGFFPIELPASPDHKSTNTTSRLADYSYSSDTMKGIIQDTGLDNLVRVISKPGSILPAPDPPWWPRSYQGTAYCARNRMKELFDGGGVEKQLSQQPSNATVCGHEGGVVEDVVGWHGPDDPEVLWISSPQKFATDSMT